MKTCPNCRAIYPTHFAVCPRDASQLIEADEWSDGMVIRGKYRILSKVGQGGMGAVYKALHMKFDQVRALKVMTGDMAADANFVKRFEREAVLMSRLQHPNVVRVDDIDESEDGRPFIVMEFVEGRSLRRVIEKEGPLQPLRACSIARQAAAGLGAAHQMKMVHRDVKPENIVLVNTPAGETAKVLDFGIAKLKEAKLGDGLRTETGIVIGTVQYLSPEQAMGRRSEELDGRSDLYSLGLVMYQMLTCGLPFRADSAVGWMMARLNESPRPIQSQRPDLAIPEPLAKLVMCCLEKDRDLRPPDAPTLIGEIERVEVGIQRSAEAYRVAAVAVPVPESATSTVIKTCPRCHESYPGNYTVCTHDGARLADLKLWAEGRIISGRYRLLANLDKDFVCVVFQALRLQPEQACALEAPTREAFGYQDSADPDALDQHTEAFKEAFKQTALRRMKIQHPNVGRVDAVEQDDNDWPYCVMEAVEGKRLADVIRQEGALAPPRACAIARQMAAGLGAAHAQGLVHGFVHPEGIFLCADAAGEKVKLIGFGRSQLQEALLSFGFDVVPPPFTHASPEAVKGTPLDGRADFYSLGMVMYQMLTGRLPFQGDSAADFAYAQINQQPEPILSARPGLAIPKSLDRLVMQCLEKDRDKRPADAQELVREIERVEEDIRRPAKLVAPRVTTAPAKERKQSGPGVIAEQSSKAAAGPFSTSNWARGWKFWTGLVVLALVPFILGPIFDLTNPLLPFPAGFAAIVAAFGTSGWFLGTRRHWGFRSIGMLLFAFFALLQGIRVYNICKYMPPWQPKEVQSVKLVPIAELKTRDQPPLEASPATQGIDDVTSARVLKLTLQNISADARVTDWKADLVEFDSAGKVLSDTEPVNRDPQPLEPGKTLPMIVSGGELGNVKSVKMIFKEVDYEVTNAAGTRVQESWTNTHFAEDLQRAKQP